ncbi:hypothetical protein [Sorangium sp. So ce854]|uniref:hypothetical protein n=1 Tax=Sorangium sp. So ce854 TaxID=3133322 RepID=UPI003F641A31
MSTTPSYQDHVARIRADVARFLRAAGASNWREVPKPRHRLNFGDRPLSASGAFIIDATYAVQGWFSVTFDGQEVPVAVFQKYTNRGTWETTILGVTQGDCPSDHIFAERVRGALKGEARRTPV